MHLTEVPLLLVLVGLVAYAVLAGADFGAGFWTLVPGGEAAREHAARALTPVWEANHVWLVFVLVVCWTAYPVAFASIASTLVLPLFVAGIGIILRGTAYVLRIHVSRPLGQRTVGGVFALSSILTPFALAAALGAIAARRVPVGNASGDAFSSWLNATSVTVGLLAVASAAYLAAVYLAADAVRAGENEVARLFRARALLSGVVAGGVALAGLLVIRSDVPALWHGLHRGSAAAAVAVSGLAGVATLALVWTWRFELARVGAALAVGAVVAAWALAQRPLFIPGLTVDQAAAGRSTLVAVVVAAVAALVVLAPALGLLFTLVLRGRFDPAAPIVADEAPAPRSSRRPLAAPVAVACAAAGAPLTFFSDSAPLLAIGVSALLAAAVAAFPLVARED